MNQKLKEEITTKREKELEDEMILIDKDIRQVFRGNEEIEIEIFAIKKREIEKQLLTKSISTQTHIEEFSSITFQTNYIQIGKIFGIESMLWMLVHDEVIKYQEYATFLQLFSVENFKITPHDNSNQITINFECENERRSLRPSVIKSFLPNSKLQNLMIEQKNEMFIFTENIEFTLEMNRYPQNKDYYTKIDISVMTEYLKSQSKSLLNSLINHSSQAVYKSKKFENKLSEIKDCNRANVWRKLIGNKLRITPELYFNLRNLSNVNFPSQVERTINEDLKRVLRYYLKTWDLELVKNEYHNFSEYENVKTATYEEEKTTPIFDNFIWQKTDHLKIFENLKEICKCFQVFRNDIGYVQGMCRISFFFFTIFKNNIETFTMMTNFLLLREPMLTCYKFDLKKIETYENAFRAFVGKAAPECAKLLLKSNDKMISIFMMENLFTLFSNYFEEADSKSFK